MCSDSTGLLVALATLCAAGRHPGITLSACTIDHDLRPGSAEDAAWAGALCARHGVRHVIRRWEGEKPQSGLQAAARAARYDFLAATAAQMGADAILAAHTRDDQGETDGGDHEGRPRLPPQQPVRRAAGLRVLGRAVQAAGGFGCDVKRHGRLLGLG